MTTQPTALRLADRLKVGWGMALRDECAAELRRLHDDLENAQRHFNETMEAYQAEIKINEALRADTQLEPQGCDHCNHPLYAAIKCRVCGRVTEPVQEPVAWLFTNLQSGDYDICYQEDEHDHDREMWHKQPLYTAPPQRKPLTDEEIADIVVEMNGNEPTALFWRDLARAIERAHSIGGKA